MRWLPLLALLAGCTLPGGELRHSHPDAIPDAVMHWLEQGQPMRPSAYQAVWHARIRVLTPRALRYWCRTDDPAVVSCLLWANTEGDFLASGGIGDMVPVIMIAADCEVHDAIVHELLHALSELEHGGEDPFHERDWWGRYRGPVDCGG